MIQKSLTVGFSDLDGFIKLIESVGEEKAIKLLFIKFKEIEKIIDSKNGEIRKIIGDSVLFHLRIFKMLFQQEKIFPLFQFVKREKYFIFS